MGMCTRTNPPRLKTHPVIWVHGLSCYLYYIYYIYYLYLFYYRIYRAVPIAVPTYGGELLHRIAELRQQLRYTNRRTPVGYQLINDVYTVNRLLNARRPTAVRMLIIRWVNPVTDIIIIITI